MQAVNILLFASFLIGLSTGIWLAVTSRSKPSYVYLALSLVFSSFWALFILLALLSGNITVASITFGIGSFILVFLILFVGTFSDRMKKPWPAILVASAFAMTALSLMPNSVARVIDVSQGFIRQVTIGDYIYIFQIYLALMALLLIGLMIDAFVRLAGVRKRQFAYIAVGLLIVLVCGLSFNVVLPAFGIDKFNGLGPVFMLLLEAFVVVAVTKHYVYGNRVVLSEFYAVMIVFITILRAVLDETFFGYLMTFLVVGICLLFIRSVISEAEQNHRLEQDKEELKKLDKLKDEFLMITTHEINTPLTELRGKLAMIVDEKFGDFNKDQREYLKPIYENSTKLTNFFAEILEVVNLDQHKMHLNREEVDLKKVVAAVVDDYHHPENDLTLQLALPKEEVKVSADNRKISQVVEQLVNNAVKFTRYTGSKGKIEISLETDGKNAVFTVRDNGIGISSEDIKHITEKFYQAQRFDAEMPLEQQGAGLGLYISRKLIEMHHGKLFYESKGRGSTFGFSIPVV